jgi:hypothetical protein
MAKLKSFGFKVRGLAFILAVISATIFAVYYLASAANTTIGNNISTSGTLTVSGASVLSSTLLVSGAVNASSTLQVSATSTFYAGLGIGGTTTPAATLGIAGLLYVGGSGTSTVENNFDVLGNLRVGGLCLSCGGASSGGGWTDTGAFVSLLTDSDLVGVGTSTPSQKLSVQGGVLISGSITSVANITATGTLTVSGTASSSIATALGIASTSPWGTFSVEMGTNNPSFVVSNTGSSTPSLFIGGVNQNGYVGIGTFNPTEALTVNGNISNLATSTNTINPILRGSSPIGNVGNSVAVAGRYAYVITETSGTLKIFDVSTSSPALVSSVSAGNRPGQIKVAGQYAYVVGIDPGILRVFDVSNPSAPVQISAVSTDRSGYNDLHIDGKRAYVTYITNGSSFQIYDISNPFNPVRLGATRIVDPQGIYVVGRYAYVTDNNTDTLQIYDVSTSTPGLVGSVSTGDGPAQVYVSGKYAYVSVYTANTFNIIDISNPASPVQLSSVSTGAGTGPWDVIVSGRFAYVTFYDSGQLRVYDVFDPLKPVAVGTASTAAGAVSIQVSGRYAYVVGQNGPNDKLEVFDIGGLETTSANIHSLEAGNLQVRNDILAQGYLAAGSISVGTGGILSNGPLAISASTTVSSILGGLYIGTTTPATTSPNFSQFQQSTAVIEATSSQSVPLTIRGAGTQGVDFLRIQTSADVNQLVLSSAGLLGIGTSTPAKTLSVQGNALISGDLTVANLTASGTQTITGLTTFSGGFISASSSLNSTLSVTGAITGSSTLAISNLATLTGGFISSASSTVSSQLTVTGPLSASSSLSVLNLSNLLGGYISQGSSTVAAQLHVTGPLSASSSLSVSGNTYLAMNSGSVGIGTSTPARLLSVQGNALLSGDLQLANFIATGTVGIGSSTPYARLAIKPSAPGNTTPLVSVASSSDDVYFEISSTGTTTIDQLQTGVMTFDLNAGAVTWIDMPVDSGAAAGTIMSYSAMIDSSSTLVVYAESDGSGGIRKQRVGIATTTPGFTLSVVGNLGIFGCVQQATSTFSIGPTSCTDLAEAYTASEHLLPGEIVSFDPANPLHLIKANGSSLIAGVVSTNPSILIEDESFRVGGLDSSEYAANSKVPLALVGRVPVKVNLEGGEIKIGDPIALSSVPGVGKKATTSARIVGYALEDFNESSDTSYIKVFVSVENWQAPPSEESGGLLAQVIDLVKQWLESMQIFVEDGLVKLKELIAEKLTVQELCVQDTCINQSQLKALLNNAGLNSDPSGSSTPQ